MSRIKVEAAAVIVLLVASACVPATPALSAETPSPSSQNQAFPTTPPVVTIPAPTLVVTPTGTWIQLSSQNAEPDSTVTIEGFLPGGPDAAQAQSDQVLQHANVCWQGCLSGIVFQGQPVTWSADQPGHFQITFTTPSTAWIQENGTQPLVSGDYLVGIQCLGPEQSGCALNEAQASATIHLNVVSTAGEAKTNPSLSLDPSSASPGTKVSISGWAPLDEVIGSMAFGYSLVLVPSDGSNPVSLGDVQQNLDGTFTGSFIVPQSSPGLGVLQSGQYTLALQAARPKPANSTPYVLFAKTNFDITQGLTWQGLTLGQPDWIQFSGNITNPSVFAEPNHQGWLAYCTSNAIRATRDAGATWTTIPLTAVEKAAQPTYTINVAAGNQPCLTVVMDPGSPGTYYATFRAANTQYGAPPVFFLGFYTVDSGTTWNPVPVPQGTTAENFGGFWTDGKIVEAMFSGKPANTGQPSPPIEERTTDGGQTWQPESPLCLHPSGSQCLRWGPTPSQISGMGSPAQQYVMTSSDDGQTWSFPGANAELRAQGPHLLAGWTADPAQALLISGSSDFPLQLSRDYGASWTAVSLPPLPGTQTPGTFLGLQILPNGNLLAQDDNQQWLLLQQGSLQWCPAAGVDQANQAEQFTGSDNLLWWLGNLSSTPQINHVSLNSVQCK